MKIISDIKPKRGSLVDCRIQSFCDMVGYYKKSFILPYYCFGIGEGLAFCYWQERRTKIPLIVMIGRKIDVERIFTRKIGLKLSVFYPNKYNAADNNQDLINLIDNDIPVIADVDRFYLDYINELYGKKHFGLHSVLVVGYRIKDEVEFALYDFVSENLIWYPSNKLYLARISNWQPFAPKGRIYTMSISNEVTRLYDEKLIRDAIVSNCKSLLTPNATSGVLAMKLLGEEIKKLRTYANIQKNNHLINLQLRMINLYLREYEPTQTFYRMIYAYFLKEASQVGNLSILEEFACEFEEIASKWKKLSENLEIKTRLEEKLYICGEELIKLSVLEESVLKRLQNALIN
ncbi:BtrH N-terminal domain-containing protein [Caldicellulosiruptor morganii]|jgi:hypothetical protein|uniref:BtrH N-terminal domain-containing protein n=1 Tax=Caldicellulosiruptor morganii TaxID=1387555 RepID=A0ABY7BQ59_9FIRM|nr:BtrH N-terminal domain-containing protein [Caldicellulosiruptor morganii]WAM34984.1 BtrH N-terminal domain-containing protein [Caldicellulosiruptor morganii]